ncbi:MAG: lysostaphin resistance A-like protein [Pirellulales bacterium]
MFDSDAQPPRSIFTIGVLSEAALGVVAIAVGWLVGVQPLAQVEWNGSGVGLGTLAAVPLLAALWVMTRWPLGPLRSLDELVRRLVVPLFRDCSLVQLAVISAAAGFGEELLFRGLLQAGVDRWTGMPWLAIAVAGLLFGLAHPISTTYVVLAALIGVYLGWLLLATDNLLVPIVAHAVYDFVALVYLLRGEQVH